MLSLKEINENIRNGNFTERNVAMAILADYAEQEEQGLLIKLPCKVGDTVYYLELNCMKIHEMRIQGMSINYNSLLILHLGDWVAVSSKDFGKTVFLTQTEAEQALRKGSVPE